MKLLAVILTLGFFLRFYQLGLNPPSLDWDEASMAYNAYSLAQTGADEYGNKWPLAIRSFDDYKPPLYTYLAVPIIKLLGPTEWAIRLPSALAGLGLIPAVYFLGRKFFSKKVALLAALFTAISPWSIQFSRAAFEANVGILFFVLGIFWFSKSKKLAALSALAFALSAYSYHSFRLLVPLTVLLLIVIHRFKPWFFAGVLGLAFLPIIVNIFFSSSARLSMVTIFNDNNLLNKSAVHTEYDQQRKDYLGLVFDNRRLVFVATVAKNYLDHFNFDFLFLRGDSGYQHHAADMGMLYLWDFVFIIAGIFWLLIHRSKASVLTLGIFLLAPIPSAFTTGTPHPVRAMAMIPWLQIFAAVGIATLVRRRNLIVLAISGLLTINAFYYFHQYFIHTPTEYAEHWQAGYKELFAYLAQVDTKYDRILVTYHYDQPYIYYLLYNRIDPAAYQKMPLDYDRLSRRIGKYEFRNVFWGIDQNLKKTLVAGTPEEVDDPKAKVVREIYFPDGTVAFKLAETKT
jgi:4-amino-4-deoxy-L-arabinose transferase-like glycosyltransferase